MPYQCRVITQTAVIFDKRKPNKVSSFILFTVMSLRMYGTLSAFSLHTFMAQCKCKNNLMFNMVH